MNEKALNTVLKIFNQTKVSDLFAEVGSGRIAARTLLESIFPAEKRKTKTARGRVRSTEKSGKNWGESQSDSVTITGLTPGTYTLGTTVSWQVAQICGYGSYTYACTSNQGGYQTVSLIIADNPDKTEYSAIITQ